MTVYAYVPAVARRRAEARAGGNTGAMRLGERGTTITMTPTPTTGGATATNAEAQTAPPSTTSASVQLPNTTIVALGMGFIAAALVVVLATVLIRVNTVLRAARRARRDGEQVTFHDMWERWGGWWGLLFAHSSGANETIIVRRRRLKPIPQMWEVGMDKLRPRDEFVLADDTAQPLAAAPYYPPGETVPEIAYSVLVMMPSQPQKGPMEDIPEIMLGTTHLRPTVPLADAGLQSNEDDDKAEITELELVHTAPHQHIGRRRSSQPHWVMAWGLEGGRMP